MTEMMPKPAVTTDACAAMPDLPALRRRVRAGGGGRRRSIVVRLPDTTLVALSDQAQTLGLRAPGELAAVMLEQACATAWAASDGNLSDSRDAAPVLLATARPRGMKPVLASLGGSDATCHVAEDLDQAQRHVDTGRWACLVVDADSLGDLRAVVDRLVILRSRRPDLPLILITRHVPRDDFDLERLPLCDVTLRSPVDPQNLTFALQEARVNNRVWVARRRMIHLARADMARPLP